MGGLVESQSVTKIEDGFVSLSFLNLNLKFVLLNEFFKEINSSFSLYTFVWKLNFVDGRAYFFQSSDLYVEVKVARKWVCSSGVKQKFD